MAEDKWVSLGIFHPYKWRYLTPLITGFWLVAASNLSFRNHENSLVVPWWLFLQKCPSLGWSKKWMVGSIHLLIKSNNSLKPARVRFACLMRKEKANQKHWLPKWWERHDGDLNPMVKSVKNHLKKTNPRNKKPVASFQRLFLAVFHTLCSLLSSWMRRCDRSKAFMAWLLRSWKTSLFLLSPWNSEKQVTCFFLAGGGWGKVVSWSSNHHRHDKRGLYSYMILPCWIWHSSMESDWQMWRLPLLRDIPTWRKEIKRFQGRK